MYLNEELRKLKALGFFRNFEDKEDYYLVTCPFHGEGKERTPSMGINKYRINSNGKIVDEGFVHCFGCGYKARFTEFLSDLYGVSEFTILQKLQKDRIYEDKRNFKISFGEVRSEKVELEEVKEITVAGRKYLNNRKITDIIINKFSLGSDVRNNVVFPLINKNGEIIGIQKRGIYNKFFSNTKDLDKLNYLYGLYQLKEDKENYKDELYIVESIIDCLTLWSWGYRAVALMGAEISPFHVKELGKLPYDLVVATDNDEIGRGIRDKILKEFKGIGKKIRAFNWSNVMEKDINDLSREKFDRIKER